jgi:hypothetical protein
MKMSSKHIAGMLLGGLVTLSAAVAPAAAQGLSVIVADPPNLGQMARPGDRW